MTNQNLLRPLLDNISLKTAKNVVSRFGAGIFQRFSDQALSQTKKFQHQLRKAIMNNFLEKLNKIFGAGWDEIHDLGQLGGEEIMGLLQELQKELHSAVEMIIENLQFDDGFSIDTLKGSDSNLFEFFILFLLLHL